MKHDFDDGLVHAHNFACSERGRMPHVPRPLTKRDEDYDDGLVHSHGWACGERGQPSHC